MMMKATTPTPPAALTKMMKNLSDMFDHFSSTNGGYVVVGGGGECEGCAVVLVLVVVGATEADVVVDVVDVGAW
jgi:hypothetical protein